MDIKFAYWATNLGGLVFSKVPQNTDWTFRYNTWLAQTAEAVGFEYSLIAARFILTHGRGDHLEALSTVSALAAVTVRLKLIAAVHPGVVAKMGATIDHISGGRRRSSLLTAISIAFMKPGYSRVWSKPVGRG